jgi:hypothetical protein
MNVNERVVIDGFTDDINIANEFAGHYSCNSSIEVTAI